MKKQITIKTLAPVTKVTSVDGNALFVTAVPVLSLLDLSTEGNVRAAKPRPSCRQGQLQTLSEEPENFVFLHNGVTICCSELRQTGKGEITLTRGSLVNGAQTQAIVEEFHQGRLGALRAMVLVRIVETRSESFSGAVSTSSNEQDAVQLLSKLGSAGFLKIIAERMQEEAGLKIQMCETDDPNDEFENTTDAIALALNYLGYRKVGAQALKTYDEKVRKNPRFQNDVAEACVIAAKVKSALVAKTPRNLWEDARSRDKGWTAPCLLVMGLRGETSPSRKTLKVVEAAIRNFIAIDKDGEVRVSSLTKAFTKSLATALSAEDIITCDQMEALQKNNRARFRH